MNVQEDGEVMIYVTGDLLDSDCGIIAHQANCFGVFGAGIAAQIAKRFPEAVAAEWGWAEPRDKLGYFYHHARIAHLYGQYHPGANTDYLAAGTAFKRLVEGLSAGTTVGIPYGMGCGIGGGDWAVMSAILEQIASKYPHVTVKVYKREEA